VSSRRIAPRPPTGLSPSSPNTQKRRLRRYPRFPTAPFRVANYTVFSHTIRTPAYTFLFSAPPPPPPPPPLVCSPSYQGEASTDRLNWLTAKPHKLPDPRGRDIVTPRSLSPVRKRNQYLCWITIGTTRRLEHECRKRVRVTYEGKRRQGR